MAPNPLACQNRITIPYTVSGILHHHRLFVKADAAGSSYDLIHQLSGNQPWTDDLEHYLELFVQQMTTAATLSDCVLEQLEFGAFIPLEYYTPTADQGTQTGTTNLAGQVTVTFRDDLLRKAKLYWMESSFPSDLHFTSVGGPGGATSALLTDIVAPVGDNDTGFWLRSRSEAFINSFVALTSTDNDKLRRARGYI